MISGLLLKNAIISGANNILNQKNEINDLNIFPVPDGDTGTNMSMTITAAKEAVSGLGEDPCAEDVAKKASSAMLRGARGNSGVILSILFKGFAKAFKDKKTVNCEDIVEGLRIGVEDAYAAVMKPTEGTMLTVARLAHEAAAAALRQDNAPDCVEMWRIICNAARDALALTPDFLPVLKKAGVVDAGGRGVCEIFDGMLEVFGGKEIIELKMTSSDAQDQDEFRSAAAEFDDDIRFTYCTEIIIGRDTECETEPAALREYLQTIGDCVVIVDDDEIIKVHVHTETPGNVLQEGLKFGQLLAVKVENMKEQHRKAAQENEQKAEKKQKQEQKQPLTFVQPEQEYGFVAVASGDGLVGLFKDLGCLHVVSGGQTMNPSTDDIYEAIMATPAKTVFVLPNNKNIIMAAEQAVPLADDRRVIIIPSKTIPQGLSAMLAFDTDETPDNNRVAMIEYMKGVSTGSVTFAARNSEFGGNKIKEGDIIALNNGKLAITDKDPVRATLKLIKSMVKKESRYITIISGEDISDEQARSLEASVNDKFGNQLEVTTVYGGQPVYYFLVSIE
ncbi:MAG: DAK2 domain-containing protein [Clostridiales bacterium]|nr:DAK2 domain-containing protein [Clostridiales bacterium]